MESNDSTQFKVIKRGIRFHWSMTNDGRDWARSGIKEALKAAKEAAEAARYDALYDRYPE
jgi:hypothetical protein